MQIIYSSDNYQVRKYGTGETYLLLDHKSKAFVVFEDYRQSAALLEALNDSADVTLTDLYLEGVMELCHD